MKTFVSLAGKDESNVCETNVDQVRTSSTKLMHKHLNLSLSSLLPAETNINQIQHRIQTLAETFETAGEV